MLPVISGGTLVAGQYTPPPWDECIPGGAAVTLGSRQRPPWYRQEGRRVPGGIVQWKQAITTVFAAVPVGGLLNTP